MNATQITGDSLHWAGEETVYHDGQIAVLFA